MRFLYHLVWIISYFLVSFNFIPFCITLHIPCFRGALFIIMTISILMWPLFLSLYTSLLCHNYSFRWASQENIHYRHLSIVSNLINFRQERQMALENARTCKWNTYIHLQEGKILHTLLTSWIRKMLNSVSGCNS
jgi:hypothetical protein